NNQPLEPLERAVHAELVVVLRGAAVGRVPVDLPADIGPARALLDPREAGLAVRGVRAGGRRRAAVRVDRAARRRPGQHGPSGIRWNCEWLRGDDEAEDEDRSEDRNERALPVAT